MNFLLVTCDCICNVKWQLDFFLPKRKQTGDGLYISFHPLMGKFSPLNKKINKGALELYLWSQLFNMLLTFISWGSVWLRAACFSLLHLHHAHVVPLNGSHTRITGAGRGELYEPLNRIQWTLLYPPLHFLPLKTEHFFSQATDHIATEPLLTSGCLKLYHKIVGPWFFSLLSCCNLKSLLLKEGRGMQ